MFPDSMLDFFQGTHHTTVTQAHVWPASATHASCTTLGADGLVLTSGQCGSGVLRDDS